MTRCFRFDPNFDFRKARRGEKRARALTLLELLIVLGLIVVLLGIGVPSLQRMYVRNQVDATAREIQGELYRTRLEAMKSGKAIVFRCRYGSSAYEVLSKEEFDRRESANTGLGAASAGRELLGEIPITEQPVNSLYQRELPHRMVFVNRTPGSGDTWSKPILFYPNGRTSEAAFALQTTGRYAFRRDLFLRGLTGTARIAE